MGIKTVQETCEETADDGESRSGVSRGTARRRDDRRVKPLFCEKPIDSNDLRLLTQPHNEIPHTFQR